MNLSVPVTQQKNRSKRTPILILLALLAVASGFYWLTQGYVTLEDARLLHADTQLTAPVPGRVASVEVKPGQRVKKGDPLFSYDPQPLHDELAKASEQLAAIAATLPPDVLQQMTRPQEIPSQQALEEALERRRAEEKDARERIEILSTAQAKAAHEDKRVQSLLSRGRATQEQTAASRAARQKATGALDAARMAFEKTSRDRAAAEEKLQRLRVAAQRVGTANMPVFMRVKAYEEQLATVRAAQAGFANITVRSPQDGVVTEFLFAPGASLTSGQPYMRLGIVGETAPLVVGYSTSAKASGIKTGQTCKINLPNVGAFTGIVESTARLSTPPFSPRAGTKARADTGYYVVQARLDATTTYEIATQPELSMVTVTVVVRD